MSWFRYRFFVRALEQTTDPQACVNGHAEDMHKKCDNAKDKKLSG